MPDSNIINNVFSHLDGLHNCGFRTWVSKVEDLCTKYSLHGNDFNNVHLTNKLVKIKVIDYHKLQWLRELNNCIKYPILRTYRMYKHHFEIEPHLKFVKNHKHRRALSKLRCSSHILEIERGRYSRPKTPIMQRLCPGCNILENEIHFITTCKLYHADRCNLYTYVLNEYPAFLSMTDLEKFLYLLGSRNEHILCQLAKFVYNAFHIRNSYSEQEGILT